MDNNLNSILFALLRSSIRGTKLTEEEQRKYSPDLLQDLLQISSNHDLVHLLALGLKQNALITKENAEIEKSILKAAYRYERIKYEYEKLCDALEAAHISFIPLKGSVLRQWYPEPWMRTSCDIDVLVHENDIEKAKSVLVNDYGYVYHGKGSHDISLFTPANTHIELHYTLVEDGIANDSSEVLKNVWDMAVVRDGYKYWFEMSDEIFYFYHIAHMAKHFVLGGCGIRTFIDLWILDRMEGADKNKRDNLLRQGGLYSFAEASRLLSRVWLENAKHETVSKQMEEYVLRGCVYGTTENRVAIQQQKKGGKLKYILSRIFLPYNVIKFLYPILQKHKWLTPFMEIHRWFRLIFCGRAKHVVDELKFNQSVSADSADITKNFLESIGL